MLLETAARRLGIMLATMPLEDLGRLWRLSGFQLNATLKNLASGGLGTMLRLSINKV